MSYTYRQSDAMCEALELNHHRVPTVSDQLLWVIPTDAKKTSWGGYDPRWSKGGSRGLYTKARSDKRLATMKQNGNTTNSWKAREQHKDSTKQLISKAAKERGAFANGRNPNNEKLQCPYCKKEGPKPGMKRWHFDKCKEKF